MPHKSKLIVLKERLATLQEPNEHAAWLGPARLAFQDETLHVIVNTRFIADFIRQKYNALVAAEAEAVFENPVKITYVVAPQMAETVTGLPSSPPEAIFRAVLPDAQTDLFVPDLAEVALKDDVHLMELAPFSLQPRGETRTELTYTTTAGMEIKITANPKFGLPTSSDYNIVLMMESYLANLANHYRDELSRYQKANKAGRDAKQPAKPPRYFEPTLSEILSFTRSHRGGVQQDRIVPGLERLHNTTCRIDMVGRRKTRKGAFNFINGWDVITENATGNVTQVRIHIPEWVYEGIVETSNPTILTYDRDYLLLNDPFMMVFYRFVRLKVPTDGTSYIFTAIDLHARSNSRQSLKEFNRELRSKIKKTRGLFFGYRVAMVGNRDTLGVEVQLTNKLIGGLGPEHYEPEID